ncbi:MAG: cysteine--tRNA ligase [Bacteroidota bacterium]
MPNKLKLYNTLTRRIVDFEPLDPRRIGIYWCGPTTYAPAHLGHARSAIVLDTLVRTLQYLGYNVCSVRNITDVGHMLDDSDEGEDKVGRAARLEQVNPMEVVQRYTLQYHDMLKELGTLPPQIEPRATGHITEQIALVQQLLHTGFAYEVNGSVYFDVHAFDEKHNYGRLSGRDIDTLMSGTRPLTSQQEKKSPLDFALWKKAAPQHIMRWPSPWGEGFPGWHLECTAMSQAYLGLPFDIHGGGLDLCFPHHECEIAQAKAAYQKDTANYWIHHNMVTLEGKKMSKSDNHFITLAQCFTGEHPRLSQPYNPMAVRLLLLQAHYRSPLDISDHALQAAQKGYDKLINGLRALSQLTHPGTTPSQADPCEEEIRTLCEKCQQDLLSDLNSPKLIANLFDLRKYIHQIDQGNLPLSSLSLSTWHLLTKTYTTFVQEILGLQEKHTIQAEALIQGLIDAYTEAKVRKDYAQVDHIRQTLQKQRISLQDRREKVSWQWVS